MPNSTLFNILYSARHGSPAERAAALVTATAYLQSLFSPDTGRQLTYQGGLGRGVLHLLALFFLASEQATPFLLLVIERSRESCGTVVLMSLLTNGRLTPLHYFASTYSDLSLTKVVLREHPSSLTVLDNDGDTPLHYAESYHGSNSERAVFFRAATAAYNASNYVALVALCDGSSPYLAREIRRQAIALRAAVAISLNRQEAAPSALSSAEAGGALSLLGRLRDFGRVGNSSDLLRIVLEFVGRTLTEWRRREMKTALVCREGGKNEREGE